MSEAVLCEGCERLGIPASSSTISKLLKLKDFLRFYGRAMNLTGSDDEGALDAHILEGLQVVALARQLDITGRWLDVGSGGGFPGLVLAACLEVQLVLVEPRAKRASVLELGLAKLGRRDAVVLRGRLEGGKWKPIDRAWLEPGFDGASARAVFAPKRWVEEATPWMKTGGVICLHLRVGEGVPEGCVEVGRVEGDRWAAVGVRRLLAG